MNVTSLDVLYVNYVQKMSFVKLCSHDNKRNTSYCNRGILNIIISRHCIRYIGSVPLFTSSQHNVQPTRKKLNKTINARIITNGWNFWFVFRLFSFVIYQ